MTHVYRSSGLPWTSKGFQVEPKLFIKIKPLAIQSQKGYKIRTRSEQQYSCADRPRDQIFKDNYDRRQFQVKKCGYWSDISKPYRPVGDVELDTRMLLLRTLDQQDPSLNDYSKDTSKQIKNMGQHKRRERKSFKLKDVSEKQEPYCRKAEMIIRHELNEGRNRMAVVKSGSNFFDVIKSEQKAKEDAIKAEKKPTYSRENWRPAQVADGSDESSEDDSEGEEGALCWEENSKTDYWTSLGIPSPAPSTPSRRRSSAKSRRSLAPQPVYFVSTSSSVIRTQLQVLRWFLEAMRSDNSTLMVPITSAWAYKTSESNSTLESKKVTQSRWKSFIKSKHPNSSVRPKSAATVAAISTSGTPKQGEESTEQKEDQMPASLLHTVHNTGQDRDVKKKPLKRPSTSPGWIGSSAAAAAGTLSPTDMRSKFCTVAENKAESLTQQLASMERSRSTACRKKFTSLELTGVINKDLQDMRASVALDTEDTARRKIMYNFHWFDDLLADLPCARDDPKYLSALQKLYALSQSQQALKRYTKERYFSIILTLREWELQLAEVASVSKFIRERIIFLPEAEYKEWYHQCYNHR
ncbi:uncharacterized protein LOC134823527 isoform X2 [Bolinopsis microptera]|uniref:uncharacterized protein LOC134823527 isoform X2 n=1 Tax=Bolinopsis microptera TaxID=2820187 RepID=UPI003078EA72